jgi:uncharacterized protein involved in exopolysaccharide biosynthesis
MNGTVYEVLHVLFKRKRVVALAFLFIFVPVAYVALTKPRLYRASARLTVTQARAYALLSPKEEARNVPLDETKLITAAVQNLQSNGFLRHAAEALAERGQHTNGNRTASANWWTRRLVSSLEVTPQSNAAYIDVAFRAGAPDTAAEVVNTIAKRYVYYQAQVMFDNPTLYAFYDEQRGAAERELREADFSLVRFQETANIFSLEEQKLQLARAQAQAYEQLDLNSGHISHAEAEARALMARLKELPAQLTLYTFGDDPQIGAINSKVVALELELNNLRQLYTDDDRRVRSVLEQLELARVMLANERETAQRVPSAERVETNVAYQEILQAALRQQAAAEAFRARREELDKNVGLAAERLRELNRLGYEFERLKAVRDAKKQSYDLFLALVEQSRAAGAMDQAGLTNVQVIDYAQVPRKPLRGNAGLTLTMGLLGALVAGVGGAFGIETMRTTVHGRRDGEMRLGLPVLGVVPERA